MNKLRQMHIICGTKVGPSSGQYLDVVNPATGEVIGETAAGNSVDVDLAVDAARVAFESWKNTSAKERAHYLANLALLFGAHMQELAVLESRACGIQMGRLQAFDFPGCLQMLQNYAENLEQYPFIQFPPVHGLPEAHDVKIIKEPLGVCALITPWNGPIFLFLVKAIPALAAGNTVILKPPESGSLAPVRLAELMQEVFPPGVVNVVTGLGSEAGAALVQHPGVNKISFTGSTATGKLIQKTAADTLKRVTLELGGKGPGIVLPDADLDLTARGASYAFLFHSGQICVSGTRLLVHESIHDELVEKMVDLVEKLKPGDPLDPATTLCPQAFQHDADLLFR